jgi:hypothetical protein
MVGGLVAWALVLGGLAVRSHRTDPPTVREQRDLAAAVAVVNEAMGRTVGLAGQHTVPVIMPIAIEKGCRITPFRDGATATGIVRVFTEDGGSRSFLERFAYSLPRSYQAVLSADGNSVRADAGEFVAVRAKLIVPGEVQVTATSGCRPDADEVDNVLPDSPRSEEPAAVLRQLGAGQIEQGSIAFAQCPFGNPATTAGALGHGVAEPLAAARKIGGSGEILDGKQAYVYRRGETEGVVVLPRADGEAQVYVSQLC